MPTVRHDIKPLLVFPAPRGEKEAQILSVFPAEAWEKWGGEPGMYRLMLGETWVTRRGERVSFFEREGFLAVVQRWALAPLVTDPDASDFDGVNRETAPGTYVWYADPATGRSVPARTNSYPFQDIQGDWRVYLMYPRHLAAVPLDFLSLRQRGEGDE